MEHAPSPSKQAPWSWYSLPARAPSAPPRGRPGEAPGGQLLGKWRVLGQVDAKLDGDRRPEATLCVRSPPTVRAQGGIYRPRGHGPPPGRYFWTPGREFPWAVDVTKTYKFTGAVKPYKFIGVWGGREIHIWGGPRLRVQEIPPPDFVGNRLLTHVASGSASRCDVDEISYDRGSNLCFIIRHPGLTACKP